MNTFRYLQMKKRPLYYFRDMHIHADSRTILAYRISSGHTDDGGRFAVVDDPVHVVRRMGPYQNIRCRIQYHHSSVRCGRVPGQKKEQDESYRSVFYGLGSCKGREIDPGSSESFGHTFRHRNCDDRSRSDPPLLWAEIL